MTNHPGRSSARTRATHTWALKPATPAELRALIELAGITQAEAARRCHASDRTMRHWLCDPSAPEHRQMPLSASELLALSLMWPGESRRIQPDLALVERWLSPQFAGLILSM